VRRSTPAIASREAKVCRSVWGVTSSPSPAFSRASSNALRMDLSGFPLRGEVKEMCSPPLAVSCKALSALRRTLFSGTVRFVPFFAVGGLVEAVRERVLAGWKTPA
jgi:hypothetical protein